ncbi:hypothetical protein ACFYXS_28620 [Streptomyces sp. NPDC002574]|uniref:hypothetical protein n=1 Tax=Streptomyces sp. NPDC002574 TaxID=3364652 RepID=UPI0036B33F46
MNPHVTVTWQAGDAGIAGKVLSRDGWKALQAQPEWLIREQSFFGKASISVGDTEFPFARATVIDFIESWRYGLDELALRAQARVELAEQRGTVNLSRDTSTVTLSTPHDQRTASCSFIDLLAAILKFAQSSLDELTRTHPDLLVHDLVERLFRNLGMRQLGQEQFRRHTAAVTKRLHREA